MAKDQPESNDPSQLPQRSDGREDSALQDILAVAAKIKDSPDEPVGSQDMQGEDSGVIKFTAGDLDSGDDDDADDALFGNFSGSLGAGFGTAIDDPLSSPDLTPLGGEGSVRETSPAEITAKPAEEPKRKPLVVFAVVLGLAMLGAGWVYVTHEESETADQQAQAEMSAKPDAAAVGMGEPVGQEGQEGQDGANAEAGANAGVGVDSGAEAIEPDAQLGADAGETGAAELAGETEGAAGLGDADDPMAQKQNLLEGGDGGTVAKAGKWDQGTSASKPSNTASPEPKPDPEPEPDPEPVVAPKPDPAPTKPAGGGGNDDEVDCLLNPDLAKCQGDGGSAPKNDPVLAPKLPDKLSSSQLRDGFNSVKSKAKACGAKLGAAAGTKVKVHVSIDGATGKVTSVKATGEHAGTDLGTCVEGVVKGATFEQFKKPAMGIDYSMIM